MTCGHITEVSTVLSLDRVLYKCGLYSIGWQCFDVFYIVADFLLSFLLIVDRGY
jgi:hypothetical protein